MFQFVAFSEKSNKTDRKIQKMWKIVLLIISLPVIIDCVINITECPNLRADLSALRKRRHVTFPDGSNIVLTISLVKAFMTHAPAGWNIALEIDVLFPLPDANFTLAKYRKKLHHQQKREFWDRLRGAMDLHNINGRSCVLKSICEARIHLMPPGVSLIHDILRAVFTAPRHEKEFIEEVRPNYNELEDPDFCDNVSDCPFSLLNFVNELNLLN